MGTAQPIEEGQRWQDLVGEVVMVIDGEDYVIDDVWHFHHEGDTGVTDTITGDDLRNSWVLLPSKEDDVVRKDSPPHLR